MGTKKGQCRKTARKAYMTPQRSGFNFLGFRSQVKVGLLGEKGYYDKSYFNQIFGKLRRRK